MIEHKNYFIQELENNKMVLVKILNEYNSKEEAKTDLFKLTVGEACENDLLKKYSKKNPFK